jgi:RNA polymerase sigma-70 factor (ECF subfamily)
MPRSSDQLHDEWLVLRCQAGESGAFEDLVRQFEPGLVYYAIKLLGSEAAALDAMQDVWLTTFRTIRKLREPASVRAWLHRKVHGTCVDAMRRGIARRRAETTAMEMSDEVDPAGDEAFDADDAAMVHAALGQLGDSHREVLVLFFIEEFSTAEIASIVMIPEGTVKSRLHHAKKVLRAILEKGDKDII